LAFYPLDPMRPLRHLKFYVAFGLTYVTFIIYECLIPHPLQILPPFPHVDKLEHLVAFGLMMGWFGQLAVERRLRSRLALAFMALGGLIEILQGAMGLGRSMEFGDFVADAVGVLMAHWMTRQRGGLVLVWWERKMGAGA
jgi:hypothetical protein